MNPTYYDHLCNMLVAPPVLPSLTMKYSGGIKSWSLNLRWGWKFKLRQSTGNSCDQPKPTGLGLRDRPRNRIGGASSVTKPHLYWKTRWWMIGGLVILVNPKINELLGINLMPASGYVQLTSRCAVKSLGCRIKRQEVLPMGMHGQSSKHDTATGQSNGILPSKITIKWEQIARLMTLWSVNASKYPLVFSIISHI